MEAEFLKTVSRCCLALIVQHHVLKMWLVPTAWGCWFLCMRISCNSLGACIEPVPGMAHVPASLFPICQGKTWDPWQADKLPFYPSLWARKLCSNSLYFFTFSGHCYDAICLGRFSCCGGGLHLGCFIWAQSERKKSNWDCKCTVHRPKMCALLWALLQRVTAVDQSLGHGTGLK